MFLPDKISSIEDMKSLMVELRRMEIKFLYDFYGALQDFPSKKFLPQWLQKKGVKSVYISEKGNDILIKINTSKKLSAVIYDIETPDLNGLGLLAALDKNPEMKSRCRVILVIPQLTHDVKSKLLNSGVSALVQKPLSEDSMQAAFAKIGFDF